MGATILSHVELIWQLRQCKAGIIVLQSCILDLDIKILRLISKLPTIAHTFLLVMALVIPIFNLALTVIQTRLVSARVPTMVGPQCLQTLARSASKTVLGNSQCVKGMLSPAESTNFRLAYRKLLSKSGVHNEWLPYLFDFNVCLLKKKYICLRTVSRF